MARRADFGAKPRFFGLRGLSEESARFGRRSAKRGGVTGELRAPVSGPCYAGRMDLRQYIHVPPPLMPFFLHLTFCVRCAQFAAELPFGPLKTGVFEFSQICREQRQ